MPTAKPGSTEDIAFLGRHLKIDDGIRRGVQILRENGVETFESCEGGDGHACPEPTIRFNGGPGAGWHALSVALNHGLPVLEIQRSWQIEDGIPAGPFWVMTFREKL